MSEHDRLYLGHMLDTARKAVSLVRGLDRRAFDNDETLRLALTHLVRVIGEAARRVSPEACAAHPQIPWRNITGKRHRIVHDYMNVDEPLVWEVVTGDLPPLVDALAEIVGPSNAA